MIIFIIFYKEKILNKIYFEKNSFYFLLFLELLSLRKILLIFLLNCRQII
jgi:hypothetical protein